MSDIKELRKKIDAIDKQMTSLYEQRMEVAKEIGEYKKANGLDVLNASREEEVINNNLALIKNEEIKSHYVNFIKEVMKESKEYQSKLLNGMKVGYSGVPGSFSYIAAKRMYPNANLVAYSNFDKAYKACENGDIEVVILPIENSYAGDVGLVMDLLFQGSLKINKMYELEVVQNLLGVKGASKESIKTVISHPQALAQSNALINKYNYQTVEASNTALAAIDVKNRNDISVGTIASKETAELYGLEVIESNVNIASNNTTRFASFSRIERKPSPDTKMGEHFILVYTVKNDAGALAQTLNIIGAHGFNMRNLRSRPMKELMWNYYFFVEIEGNINTPNGKELLNELGHICDRLKLVGTYYDFKEK